ncbi:MAG TPA: nucleotidyltransferase family protein [Candidatus Polarisedimenticolaceae bacterium]|nr:nucleotidyltransferase family protein [Candidatus Polarisedimenticolaceae bacterium]
MTEPWTDERVARTVLGRLASAGAGDEARGAPPGFSVEDRAGLAAWLIGHDLAGLGFRVAREADPPLADLLAGAALGAAAGNLSHFETLSRIEERLAKERIPFVLLKGAAIAGSAYRESSDRSMSDIDLWVRPEDMPGAVAVARDAGLRQVAGLPDRPPELQRHSGGELVFRHLRRDHGIVELHYSAFQGWWVRRAAEADAESLWERSVPMGPGRHARRLSPEDAILHTAFHLVVNQLRQAPLRGLMDLGVLSRAYRIDWEAVADRARAWRLATAAWTALETADRLVGLPGCAPALARLRPGAPRRAALRGLVPRRALLAGRDVPARVRRHLLMLALVDRPRDVARLVGRTLWPEPWWLDARYGRRVSRFGHLFGLMRRGEV